MEHGTVANNYSQGCRCTDCRAHHAAWMREYRKDPAHKASHRAITKRWEERTRRENPELWERVLAYRREFTKRRRALVNAIKLASGCIDCGWNAHPHALDFDHRPGEVKLFEPSRGIVSRKWPLVLAEIAKCDIVCSNCHRIRTSVRADW